ncbi:MAG: YebG family protein [Desulfobacteraceae bacterium]|jgi:dsDNA-binding SOS-regulon protein
MPVEVRYHVIREGKEIAVYTSKKEADAHDKMLDIAETLVEFIGREENISIEDDVLEELCIYLSKNREDVVRVLKGMKPSSKGTKSESLRKDKAEIVKSDKTHPENSTTTNPKKSQLKSIQKDQPEADKTISEVKEPLESASTKKRRKVAGAKG